EKSGHAELQILDAAYVPTRPVHGRGSVFFVGFAMVSFFTFGIATLRVLLDDTLYDEADVEALPGQSLLVTIPHLAQTSDLHERAIEPRNDEEWPLGDEPDERDTTIHAPGAERPLVLRPSHNHETVEAAANDTVEAELEDAVPARSQARPTRPSDALRLVR